MFLFPVSTSQRSVVSFVAIDTADNEFSKVIPQELIPESETCNFRQIGSK